MDAIALSDAGITSSLLDLSRNPDWARLADSDLTENEKAEFLGLGGDRRKRDWLAARACLKRLLLDARVIRRPRDCEIHKDAWHRPFPVLAGKSRARIAGDCSLSHKNGLGFAGWTSRPGTRIGVDVELRSGRPNRLRSAFAHPEDDLPAALDPPTRDAVLWALKEAALKALGSGLAAGPESVICRGDDASCRISAGDGRVLAARYRTDRGRVLAVAWFSTQRKE